MSGLLVPGAGPQDAADGAAAGASDRGREVVVTVTGDGTFRAPSGPEPELAGTGAADGGMLAALERLRSLLGSDLEEQVAARPFLPAALGTDATDHLLPASLVLLADTTGDLASYGWRVGSGASRAWRLAADRRERVLDAARLALLGHTGDLTVTTLGPVTLAGATFLASGERTLSDRGALRDLPLLLAEGVAEHLAQLARRVPGARPRLLLREDGAAAVHGGLLPTPSGYRRYPAIPAEELAPLWRSLLLALEELGLGADRVTLAAGESAALLRAGRSAGPGALAVAPSDVADLSTQEGRIAWEGLATAREDGIGLELVLDPARARAQLDGVAGTWHRLGYGPADLAGFILQARAPGHPGVEGVRPGLLTEADLVPVLREAPRWAGRTQA